MPGLIRRSDIDEVRARVNIADIVGDYVALKSAGVGSLKGLCPFHDERSPSFHVRPAVGRYKCFGCGEGGDVFTFLQRMDHVSFSEAVERMASQIGYELHYEDGGRTPDQGSRARLLAANEAAGEFFVAQLATPGADEARKFLGARGFDAGAARDFGVGFAPRGWNNLTAALGARGFTEQELVAAGLVSTGERGSAYDRFRGRLIWPIRDQTGQTIGFGARRLFDDDQGPKYLNTPDTSVYHKSQVLYGLDRAKRDIARNRQVVVVEGYTDVMACHLAGVTTAVATCGTAFGVDHIKVIRRVMGDDTAGLGEVIFTFDPDAAGQKAAMRAFAEEQRFAAQTYVAVAPDGLDPCDLRLAAGNDAVRRLIDRKRPMFEFVIRQRLAGFDLDTVEGRVGALRASAPAVAEIRDPALRPGYTRELARLLGMELGEVTAAVARAASPSRSGLQRSESPAPRSVVNEDARAGDSADSEMPAPSIGLDRLPNTATVRLERDALMAMLQAPTLVGHERLHRATQSAFSSAPLAAVRDALAAAVGAADRPDWVEQVLESTPPQFTSLVEELAVAPLPERPERELQRYVAQVVSALIERDLSRRKDEVIHRLQRSDPAGDPQRYRDLQRTLVDIEAERRALMPE